MRPVGVEIYRSLEEPTRVRCHVAELSSEEAVFWRLAF